MLRQRGFHEAKMRRVLAILQHHRDANDRLHPGLFGRILRIAEDYDTLSRRSGKLSPTMALAAMQQWAGTRYDAVLLQLLVNALGAYPLGALLARRRPGRLVGCCPGSGDACPAARLKLSASRTGKRRLVDLLLLDLRATPVSPAAARFALTTALAQGSETVLGIPRGPPPPAGPALHLEPVARPGRRSRRRRIGPAEPDLPVGGEGAPHVDSACPPSSRAVGWGRRASGAPPDLGASPRSEHENECPRGHRDPGQTTGAYSEDSA
jgi:hypothetical protein